MALSITSPPSPAWLSASRETLAAWLEASAFLRVMASISCTALTISWVRRVCWFMVVAIMCAESAISLLSRLAARIER